MKIKIITKNYNQKSNCNQTEPKNKQNSPHVNIFFKFIKNFNKSLLKPKQGFSGFPNESMRREINNYKKTIEFLEIKDFEKLKVENNLALEWKFLNVEYFLKKIFKL